MYLWRKLSPDQQAELLRYRELRGFPKHSPPHWNSRGEESWMLTGACYEHAPFIGTSPERMTSCEERVLTACAEFSSEIFAWCILPNHYHVLLSTDRIGSS